MKKLLILFSLLMALSVGTQSCQPQHHDVQCYKQWDAASNAWIWYYLLYNNGHSYYYSSPNQITNFTNVNWSTDQGNFDPTSASAYGTQAVESSGFSESTQEALGVESSGFDNNSEPAGYESSGFDNGSSSESSSSGSESSGFDSGSSSDGGSSGSDGGGFE